METTYKDNPSTSVEGIVKEMGSAAKMADPIRTEMGSCSAEDRRAKERDDILRAIGANMDEWDADAWKGAAHPKAEVEEQIPASCRNIEFDSLESEEVISRVTQLHQELEETKEKMHRHGLSTRIYAWTVGKLLQRLKVVHKRKFRQVAETQTGISQATISRYLRLAKSFGSVEELCAKTDSLQDAYLRVGALGKEGKPSIRVYDRARKSLSSAVKLMKKVVLEGEALTEDEQGKLRALAEEFGALLQKLANPRTPETSEAIAA